MAFARLDVRQLGPDVLTEQVAGVGRIPAESGALGSFFIRFHLYCSIEGFPAARFA